MQRIADYRCRVGENPLWHPEEKKLYWLDIPRGLLFYYDPHAGEHGRLDLGAVTGGFTLQEDGALLLFMERGAIGFWRNGQLKHLMDAIPEERETRFNDVIADPCGRVFCGTMSTPDRPGRLYRLDPDGSLHGILENVGTPNGMGFTPDGRGLYFTDTRRREISIFDYDRDTGDVDNRRVFVSVPEDEGGPDGMTVDAEGYVWSAQWGGGCVVRYTPSGREERRIPFPARKVSSLTFGGRDYRDIYVTTAGGDNKEEEGEGAGALYRLNTGIKGVPEFRSRIEER